MRVHSEKVQSYKSNSLLLLTQDNMPLVIICVKSYEVKCLTMPEIAIIGWDLLLSKTFIIVNLYQFMHMFYDIVPDRRSDLIGAAG